MSAKMDIFSQLNRMESKIRTLRVVGFFLLSTSFFSLAYLELRNTKIHSFFLSNIGSLSPKQMGADKNENGKGDNKITSKYEIAPLVNVISLRKIEDTEEYHKILNKIDERIYRLVAIRLQLQAYNRIHPRDFEFVLSNDDLDCQAKVDSIYQINNSLRKRITDNKRIKRPEWAMGLFNPHPLTRPLN